MTGERESGGNQICFSLFPFEPPTHLSLTFEPSTFPFLPVGLFGLFLVLFLIVSVGSFGLPC